jgi:3-oxoacyl-[acyl-carrier-protein] synthase-3
MCRPFAGLYVRMSLADSMIKSGAHKNVLIIGAEVFSRILNFEDRTTCVLFGDGAGAVVMSARMSPGCWRPNCMPMADTRYFICARYSQGAIAAVLMQMDGQAVFKLAVSVLEKVANEAWQAGLKAEDIDWLIPHQANLRIMHSTAKKMRLPLEKLVVTVDQHGNTSAASIPWHWIRLCAMGDSARP